METVREFVGNHGWVAEVTAIVFLTALAHTVARVLLRRLERTFEKTHNRFDDALIAALKGPFGILVWVLGIAFAAQVVGGPAPADVFAYVPQLRTVAVILLVVWFSVRFINHVESHIKDPTYPAASLDTTTALAVGRLLRITVMVSGALMILQYLGIPITGVLAFGGVGGLAVGFAAKDLLANFFGALMIFLDRPFKVGDWICSPDREIEGTVEDIGWRLTRIRTFDKRPLYVPNSVFTSITVENPSRMLNRRIYETIGVRYADVNRMRDIVAGVENMLREHPDIDTRQTLIVNLVSFGASSVDFMVYTFTKTTVWTEYHQVKQDVLLRIAEVVAEHGAEMAFPTRTLHVYQEGSSG